MAHSPLFREIHAAHKVLEARVRAQVVDPQVGPQKVRKVGGSFLVCFFEVFEGFVLVSQTGVDRRDHIGRDIAGFRLALPFAEYLLHFGPSACGRIRVCQRSGRILITLR